MGPDEIAALYLGGGSLPDDEEEKPKQTEKQKDESAEAIAARYLADAGGTSAPRTPTRAQTEGPGFLTRTLERMQGGVSDAMSTLAGDTYGVFGDNPAERTPLPASMRFTKALGGDILGAAGESAADAIVSATPDAVKEGLTKTREWMAENQARHPIYRDASIEGMGEVIDEIVPEQVQEIVSNTANIVPAMPRKPSVDLNAVGDRRLAESLRQMDRKETQAVLEPYNIKAPDAPGDVVEEGLFRTQRYVPTDFEERVYDAAESVEGWNPRRSARHNINALETEVDNLKVKLDKDLYTLDSMPVTTVQDDLAEAITSAKKNPLLSGDAGTAAERIYAEYARILEKYTDAGGEISPRDLLETRRELDSWIRSQKGDKAFSPEFLTANSIATAKIRTAVNDRVSAAVPDAKVKESLQRQSDLLTARDHLYQRDMAESRTGLGRAAGQVEQDFDAAPPKSPLAIKANLTDLASMILTGTATAASLGGRGAIRAGMKLKNSAAKELRAAKEASNRAAVLAILEADDSYEE